MLCSCQKKEEEAVVEVQTSIEEDEVYTGPLLVFANVETFYSQTAEVKLRLVAPTQWHMDNNDEIFPDGVHITFFDQQGKEKTTLVSDSAQYIAEIRTYRMVGDVVVHNMIENQKLETPILNLDERTKYYHYSYYRKGGDLWDWPSCKTRF